MKNPFFFIWLFTVTVTRVVTAQSVPPPKPYGPLPSSRQLAWEKMELIGIVHFGLNTFTDKEWGYGNVDPKRFDPKHFDPDQIVLAAKAAGIKGLIFVCKHHDGFCLWPTATTDYNITKSSWKDGKGDLVKAFELACKRHGLKFGVYCSPWDRHSAFYGSPHYVTLYREQLKELYTRYGTLFESWHDGANGGDGYYGGAEGVRKIDRSTYYGWDTTWAMTRELQPGAVIFSDVGPDVRWVGNEYGEAADTTWETYTPHPVQGARATPGNVKYQENPAGQRDGRYWMPAECDVPLRPGFFYHPSQDGEEKSPAALFDIYVNSIGRSANMNLGLAPDPEGRLSQGDVAALRAFGLLVHQTFARNLASDARITASNVRGGDTAQYGPLRLVDGDRYSYWATDDSVRTPMVSFELPGPVTFNIIQLRENIKLGQRIGSVAVDAWTAGGWKEIATATGIGANRLIKLPAYQTTDRVRLRITRAPVSVALSGFGLYREPQKLSLPVITRGKGGAVIIRSATPVSAIHYTVDGSRPGGGSPVYRHPFLLKDGGLVQAVGMDTRGRTSVVAVKRFGLSKSAWKVVAPGPPDKTHPPENAIDENERTFWTSAPGSGDPFIVIDLGGSYTIRSFTYLPRQDRRVEGVADQYAFYVSPDGIRWTLAASGSFGNIRSSPLEQLVTLSHAFRAAFVKFQVRHALSGTVATVAELGVNIR